MSIVTVSKSISFGVATSDIERVNLRMGSIAYLSGGQAMSVSSERFHYVVLWNQSLLTTASDRIAHEVSTFAGFTAQTDKYEDAERFDRTAEVDFFAKT